MILVWFCTLVFPSCYKEAGSFCLASHVLALPIPTILAWWGIWVVLFTRMWDLRNQCLFFLTFLSPQQMVLLIIPLHQWKSSFMPFSEQYTHSSALFPLLWDSTCHPLMQMVWLPNNIVNPASPSLAAPTAWLPGPDKRKWKLFHTLHHWEVLFTYSEVLGVASVILAEFSVSHKTVLGINIVF